MTKSALSNRCEKMSGDFKGSTLGITILYLSALLRGHLPHLKCHSHFPLGNPWISVDPSAVGHVSSVVTRVIGQANAQRRSREHGSLSGVYSQRTGIC